MGKKLVFSFLFCFLFLISFTSAVSPFIETDFTEGYTIIHNLQHTIKLGQDYQINFFVYNTTNGYLIDNSSITCQSYVANSSGGVVVSENATYNTDGHWGHYILGGNFSSIGTYGHGIKCQNGNEGGALSDAFTVTYTGFEITTAQAILSIGFLTLLSLIFISCFVGIGLLPSGNQSNEEGKILSISYLKYFRGVLAIVAYFLFIGIVYISSNLAYAFLNEVLIADTLFMIFNISFGLAPLVVVVWLISIFVSMYHDKEFQRMLNRGIFPQGNI